MSQLPRLLFTMGDVAGIGPEIIARAWPRLNEVCQPVVVGDPEWLEWALALVGASSRLQLIERADLADSSPAPVPCLRGSRVDLSRVIPATVTAQAGQAAYDFLCMATDLTLRGEAGGIVTAPLHKEGLRAAGLSYPGHTEILAERTGTKAFAMLLYCEGIAVAHVTLHMALRDVFSHLSTEAICEKVRLL